MIRLKADSANQRRNVICIMNLDIYQGGLFFLDDQSTVISAADVWKRCRIASQRILHGMLHSMEDVPPVDCW